MGSAMQVISNQQFELPSQDDLLREEQAARLLGLSVRALQGWRSRRCGPPYVKLSNHTIRYRRRDLIAWVESQRVLLDESART